jgi:tetratricopeptide (TPR) repeat protein
MMMMNGLQYALVRILLILLLQGIFSTVFAQTQRKIDSLKSLLPGKSDLERADIYHELAVAYSDVDYALLANYAEQSFQCAKRTGDSLRIVRAGRGRAAALRRVGELDSGLMLGLEMLPIATRNSYGTEVKKLLRGIALGYTYKADYALGFRYNFELLKITEQDNDSVEMSYALSNIGLIYYKLANHKKALQYYHRSLDVKSPLDKYPRTSTLVNMSLCYTVLGDFPRASEFLKKGLDACQPECPGAFMTEWLFANARIHYYEENLDSAEAYYLRAYSLAKKLGNERYQLVVSLDLIDIYYQWNQTSLAVPYLLEVEPIMERTSFDYEQVLLFEKFFSFYKKAGNYRKSAFYQEKYIQLVDSINNQLANNLMKIESEYLERKNKARIAEQEQLLALKDQKIWWQNALNILIGVITVLLMTLLYILYHSNRLKKSANRLLDLKVKERTAALESSHVALKQSLEKEDRTVTDTFMDLKNSTAAIKELCSLGLAVEDATNVTSKKYLQEIWVVTGRVSLVLSNVYGDRNGM